MRITKSRAYKDSERALAAAKTQEDVTNVTKAARFKLSEGEFGHFLKKVLSRRDELRKKEDAEA